MIKHYIDDVNEKLAALDDAYEELQDAVYELECKLNTLSVSEQLQYHDMVNQLNRRLYGGDYSRLD